MKRTELVHVAVAETSVIVRSGLVAGEGGMAEFFV